MPSLPSRSSALLALGALSLGAAPASAAPYEQISRASGRGGQSALAPSFAIAASDTGLGGAYGRFDFTAGFPPPSSMFVRSTLLDLTTEVRRGWILSAVDRTETIGFFTRFAGSQSEYAVGPLYGKAPLEVIGALGAGTPGSAAMSGDGKTVALADETGLRTVSVATGKVTTLGDGFVRLNRGALSDDGKVVVGLTSPDPYTPVVTGAIIFSGGAQTAIGGAAVVSPDGEVVAYLDDPTTEGGAYLQQSVVTRTLATGTERRAPVPAAATIRPSLLWISPAGDRVAVGPSQTAGVAQVVTSATGRWARFGGLFADQFVGDGMAATSPQNKPISRSGRYAALPYNGQVALVNLSGGNILGRDDPLSASSYIASAGIAGCGENATFSGHLVKPASWIAAPRKGTITVSADGVVLRTATSTTPTAVDAPDDPNFEVTLPAAATTAKVQFTVVDHAGRTVAETFTKPIAC